MGDPNYVRTTRRPVEHRQFVPRSVAGTVDLRCGRIYEVMSNGAWRRIIGTKGNTAEQQAAAIRLRE